MHKSKQVKKKSEKHDPINKRPGTVLEFLFWCLKVQNNKYCGADDEW